MSDTKLTATSYRTHMCGELRQTHVGQHVRLGGWVHRSRDLGGLLFIDLRDRAGLVQLSIDPGSLAATEAAAAGAVGAESVVLVEGQVMSRPAEMHNAEMPTGAIEVHVSKFRVVGPARTPPIPVARGKTEKLPAEELRLRHRYLDLRRPEMQERLVLRHRLLQATRRYLSENGFLEIETPILTRPTPEGARDYLVPSRVHPGEFYALPQSPQIYKQLLMVSGFDRYFQIARCFRDEDLRADRQPEFTQIDIETSFMTSDDLFTVIEGMLVALWREAGLAVKGPFQRMTHAEAMERFGTDRPDMRYGLELFDASKAFRDADFGITKNALASGGRVRGLRIPGGGSMSRRQVDELEAIAKSGGASGLLRVKRTGDALEGPIAKFLPPNGAELLALKDGDLCLMVAGPDRVSSPALDRVRQEVAIRLALARESESRFLWITDFPLFARETEGGALVPEHHPFTAIHPDDVGLLDTDPSLARALAYDVVYNGLELASGSIRINNPAMQERIFALLGIDETEAMARFGFLLEGLRAGAPPHGGIAFGFDRIAMLLAGGESLRDVIAFPKTNAARSLFEDAPARVPQEDLDVLHIAPVSHD